MVWSLSSGGVASPSQFRERQFRGELLKAVFRNIRLEQPGISGTGSSRGELLNLSPGRRAQKL